MKIDESTLALWLDDELTGELKAQVDAWAASQPEQLTARESSRNWRAWLASHVSSADEPPYADFFNTKIQQAIAAPAPAAMHAAAERRGPWWMRIGLPIAACIGMLASYWAGTQKSSPYEVDVTGAPRAIPVESLIYTPESGVYAECFDEDPAAMVIVLDGLKAIPDGMDFSQASYLPSDRESDFTAQQSEFQKPSAQP